MPITGGALPSAREVVGSASQRFSFDTPRSGMVGPIGSLAAAGFRVIPALITGRVGAGALRRAGVASWRFDPRVSCAVALAWWGAWQLQIATGVVVGGVGWRGRRGRAGAGWARGVLRRFVCGLEGRWPVWSRRRCARFVGG
jgi:hypothetical protein